MTPRQRNYGRGVVVRKKRHGVEYGNYMTRYWVGGKERTESTGTDDLADATRFLNERMGAVAIGRAPVGGVYRVTIGDLLDDLEARHKVEKAPGLRTTRTHKVALKPLAAIRAADLTTKHLQRFVADCRRHDYAEATIGRFLDTLKSAMNDGRRATPPKVATVPAFPYIDESGNVRKGFATVAQRNVILDSLNAYDPDLADAVEWKFWTGMRKGAIARLGWDLWDPETETLRLPHPGRKKKTPKVLPLRAGHPLRAILDRRWKRRKERAKETGRLESLIFWRVHRGGPTKKGVRQGDAVPVYEYRKAWDTAVEAAGCPNLTPHDLCRTAVRNVWLATKDRRMVKLVSGAGDRFDRRPVQHRNPRRRRGRLVRLGTLDPRLGGHVKADGRFYGSVVADLLDTRPWGRAMIRFWCGCAWREGGYRNPCKRHRWQVAG